MSKSRHLLLAERIAHERELRSAERAAVEHEREMRAVYDQHEREMRTANEASVEKARQLQFDAMELRLEGMNEFRSQLSQQALTFMPIDRFEREHSGLRERYEREHQALIERHVRDISILSDKIVLQEKANVRSLAQDELLATIEGNAATNRRWMIGLGITVAIFGITTLIGIGTSVLHAFNII